MKRVIPLLAGAYLVALGHYGAIYFGDDWRRDLLVGLLGLYALLALLVPLYERHVRESMSTADPRTIEELRQQDPEFNEFLADRPRVNERVDWTWRATDLAAGIGLAFYPPLAYTFLRYQELDGETPFDPMAVVGMLAGTSIYLLWRRRRLRHYQCPNCELQLPRLHSEVLRYSCAQCGVTWQLGEPIIGDPRLPAPPT